MKVASYLNTSWWTFEQFYRLSCNNKQITLVIVIYNTTWDCAKLLRYDIYLHYLFIYLFICRAQWPRGLRRGSAVARLLGLRVRIPPEHGCLCCVLSGRFFCVGLITRSEESYRMWHVWVWSWSLENEEALAHWELLCHWKKILFICKSISNIILTLRASSVNCTSDTINGKVLKALTLQN